MWLKSVAKLNHHKSLCVETKWIQEIRRDKSRDLKLAREKQEVTPRGF